MERFCVALALQVVLLALSIQSGLSLKCYTCNSQMNPKCADPLDTKALDDSNIVECNPESLKQLSETAQKGIDQIGSALGMDVPKGGINAKFACQKVGISDDKGSVLTMRGCTLAKSEAGEPCSMVTDNSLGKVLGVKVKKEFCDTCEHDLCNDSSRHSFTQLFLLLVPCFAIIYSSWISG